METNEVKNMGTVNTVNTVNNADDFRNKKTAAQLMREEGAGLDFYPAKTPGKLRFVCGTKAGYVSQHVTDNLESVQVEDLRFAEVKAQKEGKEVWVPTLFLAAVKVKPVKHFSL